MTTADLALERGDDGTLCVRLSGSWRIGPELPSASAVSEAAETSPRPEQIAFDACLADLSPQARRALALRFADKLPRTELAARLGIGTHGAKSLLQRSYARLRLCIERRLRDGSV